MALNEYYNGLFRDSSTKCTVIEAVVLTTKEPLLEARNMPVLCTVLEAVILATTQPLLDARNIAMF